MKKSILLALIVSHGIIGIIGFAAGIYVLPILIAPQSPDDAEIRQISDQALYTTHFKKNLKGSDMLHWGKGKVAITNNQIVLLGELAPGPDYKLYLSPTYVETEEEFKRLKSSMKHVGDIKTFNNFVVNLPDDTELSQFNSLIVWCETFEEFITAAKYRKDK